jgi:UDP-N-acetylmuramate--alanine ligase
MKIHFIGIGGIGVSALVQYYLEKGHEVSGSDLTASEITDFLGKKGAKVLIGNKAENIKSDFDIVIHSPAVKAENPEYVAAKKTGIKILSYPQALGKLTKDHFTIAISGSHGKSTTTSMVSLILMAAGLDPTIIVGTKLRELGGSNFRMGHSKYLVIEACEYDGSFLEYSPNIAVITNIDKEHLDYFKNFRNIVKTFKAFIMRLPEDGWLIINGDDKGNANLKSQISKLKCKVKNYSLRQSEAKKMKLQIPGEHNISNALAALSVSRILGIKDKVAFTSLKAYRGSWRRFELKESILNNKKITVISDYGHHPTEVLATLTATREKFPKKKVWCIYQPHQYQRTHYLFKDFVKLFRDAKINNIIITDIYDVVGREEKNISQEVSSEKLVKKVHKKSVQYMPMGEAEVFVKKNIESEEVLIIMGAGDVYKLFDKF